MYKVTTEPAEATQKLKGRTFFLEPIFDFILFQQKLK